jgi:hypothetical protein
MKILTIGYRRIDILIAIIFYKHFFEKIRL